MPTRQGGSFIKNGMTRARFNCLRITALPAASMPWTWKTDFAMSSPINVTVFMWLPPNRGHLISNHFPGASAPVEGAVHGITTGNGGALNSALRK